MRVGPMDGISALIIKGSREICSPLYQVRTQQEGSGYDAGRGPLPEPNYAGILILDQPPYCEK